MRKIFAVLLAVVGLAVAAPAASAYQHLSEAYDTCASATSATAHADFGPQQLFVYLSSYNRINNDVIDIRVHWRTAVRDSRNGSWNVILGCRIVGPDPGHATSIGQYSEFWYNYPW